MKAINPAEIFSDSNTAARRRAGVAMFASFWSWVGFEMAPNYAEESRNPRRIMGPATYISVIGLGVFYTFISWMLVAGWGTENVSAAVSDQFAGKHRVGVLPAHDASSAGRSPGRSSCSS